MDAKLQFRDYVFRRCFAILQDANDECATTLVSLFLNPHCTLKEENACQLTTSSCFSVLIYVIGYKRDGMHIVCIRVR